MKTLVSREIGPMLRASGFSKKALSFHRRVGANYEVVQLQKSRHCTAQHVEFTINLGVFSERVHRGLAPLMWVPEVEGSPTEPSCHLRQRIGEIMLPPRDVWWTVDAANVPSLGLELRALLAEVALPFLAARSTDEQLRDHWLRGPEQGRDGLFVAILLRDLGPRERLAAHLARVRADAPAQATLFIAAIDALSASLT